MAPADVRLPRAFRVESYAPSLVIGPAQPTFTGSIAIAGTIAAGTPAVWLHAERMTVEAAVATTASGDVPLTVWADRAPGRIALTAPTPLPAGHVVITLRYRGTLDEVDTAGAFRQQVAGRRGTRSRSTSRCTRGARSRASTSPTPRCRGR